jgi:hypothetical protein
MGIKPPFIKITKKFSARPTPRAQKPGSLRLTQVNMSKPAWDTTKIYGTTSSVNPEPLELKKAKPWGIKARNTNHSRLR